MGSLPILSVLAAALLSSPVFAQPAQQGEPKHIALIIGNTEYPSALDNQTASPLPRLPKACEDSQTISAALVQIGWNEADIDQQCDLTTEKMIGSIRRFIQAVQDDPYSIAVFYYAGHGVQIDDRSYLFGIDAKPNFASARKMIEQGRQGQLFVGSAIELYSDLLNGVGAVTDGGLTVIIDACRSDPLIAALGGRPRLVTTTLNKPILLPGILLAHSTQKGDTAADNGAYAAAFRAQIRAHESAETILNRVTTYVYNSTKLTSHPQIPIKIGGLRLNCLAGCTLEPDDIGLAPPPRSVGMAPILREATLGKLLRASFALAIADQPAITPPLPAPAASTAAKNPTSAPTLPPTMRVLLPNTSDRAQSQSSESTRPRIETLYLDPALKGTKQVSGLRVDVFWCDGGVNASSREALARRYADRIVEAAAKSKGGILSVRLRILSEEANGSVSYRFLHNSIVFDRADRSEREAANIIRQKDIAPLEELQSSTTPDYVSVFICQTDPRFTSGRLFWQVPLIEQQSVATWLMDQLNESVGEFKSVRQVEVISQSPSDTQVRYYYPDDRDIAFRVADSLQRVLRHAVPVKLIARFASRVLPGTVETWIGTAEFTQPATAIVEPGSIQLPSRNSVLKPNSQAKPEASGNRPKPAAS